MNTKPLIDYFDKILPLDDEEMAFVEKVFKERRVKRRQFILQEGEVCKDNTFVLEGCFKMYFIDENGKEHNLQFAIENWWIGDIGSFHSEEPSMLYTIIIKTIVRKVTGNIHVFAFDAGEILNVKISPFDNFKQVIDGKAEIIIDDKSFFLENGEAIITPAHSRSTLKATNRFKMISTIIKSGYEEVML